MQVNEYESLVKRAEAILQAAVKDILSEGTVDYISEHDIDEYQAAAIIVEQLQDAMEKIVEGYNELVGA